MITKTRRIKSVAATTLREFFSKRLIWIFLAGGFCLVGLGLLLGNLSFDEKERIFLNVGMLVTEGMTLALGLTIAGNAVHSEIERQTCLMSLARPLSRGEWILGKWLGLVTVVLFFAAVMCLVQFSIFFLSFGSQTISMQRCLFAAAALALEGVLILTITFALSIRVRPILAVVGGVLFYTLGNSLPEIEFFARKSHDPVFGLLSEIFKWLVPPLHGLNVRTLSFLNGSVEITSAFALIMMLCLGWTLIYLQLAMQAFRRKDLV